MKESTKIRMSLSPETYVPPDNIPQSAPVISTRKSGIGLTSRGTYFPSYKMRNVTLAVTIVLNRGNIF